MADNYLMAFSGSSAFSDRDVSEYSHRDHEPGVDGLLDLCDHVIGGIAEDIGGVQRAEWVMEKMKEEKKWGVAFHRWAATGLLGVISFFLIQLYQEFKQQGKDIQGISTSVSVMGEHAKHADVVIEQLQKDNYVQSAVLSEQHGQIGVLQEYIIKKLSR